MPKLDLPTLIAWHHTQCENVTRTEHDKTKPLTDFEVDKLRELYDFHEQAAELLTEIKNENWVIMTGNPMDGFNVIGPWHNREEALTYAADEHWDEAWWLVEVSDIDS